MKVVFLAGGRGSRISELFPDIPKPLIPIDGVPVLEREIISLRDQGFTDIILTIGYMAEKIQTYFGDGGKWNVNISYFVEEIPLGNAGALFKLNLKEDFLLLNADVVFDVDINRMVEYHKGHGGVVTLFTHPNSHPYDSGLIVADKNGEVNAWLAKEDVRPAFYKNRVNAGLHVISPKALEMSGIKADEVGKKIDGKVMTVNIDRHILKPLCGTHTMFCYDSPEYVKDMGTPERYEGVCRDYKAGVVQEKNLKNRQKAIFIERSGVINKYVRFLCATEELELTEDATEAIKLINTSGYLAVLVSNQPTIEGGEVMWDELNEIHNKMETELGKQGAYLDAIYIYPHHPYKGDDGETVELKNVYGCRSMELGMFIKASRELNIDLNKSWMIGNSDSNVEAGNAVGCKSIKVEEGGLLETVRGILGW